MNLSPIVLVYLTEIAPSVFAERLMEAGFGVFEAISVSEVLHLCEQESVKAVVIAPGLHTYPGWTKFALRS